MTKRWVFITICVGVLGLGLSVFYLTLDTEQPDFIVIEDDRFASVHLIPDDQTDLLRATVLFPYGEAHNPFAEGLAHYVEHLAWLNMTQNDPSAGVSHSNAWTSHRAMAYWLQADRNTLPAQLENLLKLTEPITLDRKFALEERLILQREYDYRYAERVLAPVYEKLHRVLYEDQGLGRSVIGTKEEIGQFSLEQARMFHQGTHQLSTAHLIIYGDISARKLRRILSRLSMPSSPKVSAYPSGVSVPDASLTHRETQHFPRLKRATYFYAQLLAEPLCDSELSCRAALRFVENLLTSALPEGLAGPLQYDAFIAQDIRITLDYIPDNPTIVFQFSAATDRGVGSHELEQSFLQSLSKILERGVSQNSFDRIKARALGKLDLVQDRPSFTQEAVIDALANGRVPVGYTQWRQAVEALELADIEKVFQTLNQEGRRVTMIATPQDN